MRGGARDRLLLPSLVLLVASSTALAGFELKDWQFRKAVHLAAGSAPYAEVTIDGELYERAAESFQDLRLIADSGDEIPYVLRHWPGSQAEVAVPTDMVNRSVLPRKLTRFELRLQETGRAHNRIQLSIDDADFRRRVVVEGSDDRKTWLVLVTAEIFRFKEVAAVDRTTITYPQSVYQDLRVTILDEGRSPLQVRGAHLILNQVTPPREDRWVAGASQATIDPKARTTTVDVSLPHRRLPVSRLIFTATAPALFARAVTVDLSDDGQTWFPVVHTTISRGPGAATLAPIELAFAEVRGSRVRVTVANGDNAPVRIDTAAVYGVSRTLLFPIGPNRTYHLYYGSNATRPQYDLPQVLGPTRPQSIAATLGPHESNPAYIAPVVRKPWTEEHPALLWGVIGIVAVVLALLIVSTARRTGASA